MNPSNPNKISRQAMRRKMTQLAFDDINTQYKEPRKARRAMARSIAKISFKAWRRGQ